MTLFVAVQRFIASDPQTIFDVVADPAMHSVIDGSGTVRQVRGRVPARLSLGETFAMDMHLAADYKILNTVVEFDDSRVIAWRHFNGHVWRYRLDAAPGGTKVTEEWDARHARRRLLLLLLGFPRRNRRDMRQTLMNLERQVCTR